MTARSAATATPGGRWLVMIASLPTEDPAARMRILRTLESLGAAVIRDSVFLLPDTGANRGALDRLVEYIGRSAAGSRVLHVVASGPAQDEEFRALFDRSARYENLRRTVDSLAIGFGVADPSAISRVLQKQRRELEAIAALDFFPAEPARAARAAIERAEAEVRRLLFPMQSQGEARANERLFRRIWATRPPLWADRLACAWLIRRFVDPEATLIWLDKNAECPAAAVGYAFEGARFANSATRVTFEEMLQHFGLQKNPALARIGAIVHYLEANGAPVPEAAGVQTLLQGASRRAAGIEELVAEAEKTFDLLYDAYIEPAKPG